MSYSSGSNGYAGQAPQQAPPRTAPPAPGGQPPRPAAPPQGQPARPAGNGQAPRPSAPPQSSQPRPAYQGPQGGYSGGQDGQDNRKFKGIPYKTLLNAAHEKGFKSFTTRLVQLPTPDNNMVTIFEATIVGEDGQTCMGHGEAANATSGFGAVGSMVKDSSFRMAETRAKARALMDFTNRGEAEDEDERVVSSAPVASRPAPAANGAPNTPPATRAAAPPARPAGPPPPPPQPAAAAPRPAPPPAQEWERMGQVAVDAQVAPPSMVVPSPPPPPAAPPAAPPEETGLLRVTEIQVPRLVQILGISEDEARQMTRQEANKVIRDERQRQQAGQG